MPSIRPPVDATTHWLRLAGTLAGRVATSLPPSPSARRRQRRTVVWSARLLTALGVRVEVRMPVAAWPPPGTGRLVVANRLGWIDELALATVVPDARPVDAGDVVMRLRQGETVLVHPETTTSGPGPGRFRPALLQPAAETGLPLCPVAIHHRTESGAPPAAVPGNSPRDYLSRPAVRRGLVVEVRLLPALAPAGADARTLAALSDYSIGSVLRPFGTSAPEPELASLTRLGGRVRDRGPRGARVQGQMPGPLTRMR